MLWLTVYPLDVVKSIIQNDDLRKPKYKNSISYVAKTIYAKEGIRAFFKGFGPTMVRSAPVNGATFLTFELVMRFLGKSRRVYMKTSFYRYRHRHAVIIPNRKVYSLLVIIIYVVSN